ncbi:MAG TPA: hypothetical protein VHQ23_16675 [Ilumatobacteraceae bacterium]|nr:hypothetical protein [Ilumatobacteraceae bacterium]
MSTTYTVSIHANGSDADLHHTVLAGLPNSYRLVEKDAEVVLISAPEPGHLQRACSASTRAVVIDRAGELTPDALAAVAEIAGRSGCIVMPAPRYAPRLADVGDLLGESSVDILESTIRTTGSFQASFVEQLALLRVVLGEAASLRVLHASATHYAIEAKMAEHPQTTVLLNGVATSAGAEEATLHALARDKRLVVRVDAGPIARPAEISCFDSSGERTPWPVHQHAHRITLVRLHHLLSTGESNVTDSLDHLRHDVQLAHVPW